MKAVNQPSDIIYANANVPSASSFRDRLIKGQLEELIAASSSELLSSALAAPPVPQQDAVKEKCSDPFIAAFCPVSCPPVPRLPLRLP